MGCKTSFKFQVSGFRFQVSGFRFQANDVSAVNNINAFLPEYLNIARTSSGHILY